jgi:hypothetical protein
MVVAVSAHRAEMEQNSAYVRRKSPFERGDFSLFAITEFPQALTLSERAGLCLGGNELEKSRLSSVCPHRTSSKSEDLLE